MGQNGVYEKQRHYPMTRPRPFVFSQSNARKGAYYKIMGDLSAASVIQSVIEKGLYIYISLEKRGCVHFIILFTISTLIAGSQLTILGGQYWNNR